MRHLTMPQLSASLDDALSGVSLELVRRHFLICEECRARAVRIQRTDGILAQLITHDPGDFWFEAASAEIAEWIEGEVTGEFSGPKYPAGPPPWEALPRGTEPTDRTLAPRDLSAIPGFSAEDFVARKEPPKTGRQLPQGTAAPEAAPAVPPPASTDASPPTPMNAPAPAPKIAPAPAPKPGVAPTRAAAPTPPQAPAAPPAPPPAVTPAAASDAPPGQPPAVAPAPPAPAPPAPAMPAPAMPAPAMPATPTPATRSPAAAPTPQWTAPPVAATPQVAPAPPASDQTIRSSSPEDPIPPPQARPAAAAPPPADIGAPPATQAAPPPPLPGGTPEEEPWISGQAFRGPPRTAAPVPIPVPTPRRPALVSSPAAPPRGASHASKPTKARRDTSQRPRDTVMPLVAGLIGGTIAGAIIVVLVIAPHGVRKGDGIRPIAVGTASSTVTTAGNEADPRLSPGSDVVEPREDRSGTTGDHAIATTPTAPANTGEPERVATQDETSGSPETEASPPAADDGGDDVPAPAPLRSPAARGATVPRHVRTSSSASSPSATASSPSHDATTAAAPSPDRGTRGSESRSEASPTPANPKVSSPTPAPPNRTERASAPTHATTTPPAAADAAAEDEEWPLLCGIVQDEAGAPIAGARVLLADLDLGARTDRRGRFCIAAPPGSRTLSVLALGFATQRRLVTVANGTSELKLVLKGAP